MRPDALGPAAFAAMMIGGQLATLGGQVAQPAPQGTPGFMTGFQAGQLNQLWGAEIAAIAQAASAAGERIANTQAAYANTEQDALKASA